MLSHSAGQTERVLDHYDPRVRTGVGRGGEVGLQRRVVRVGNGRIRHAHFLAEDAELREAFSSERCFPGEECLLYSSHRLSALRGVAGAVACQSAMNGEFDQTLDVAAGG